MFQGAYNSQKSDFYKKLYPYFKDGARLLNLGCGQVFTFERDVSRKKRIHITSCDILPLKNKPGFIDNYIQQSVEEPFDLGETFDCVVFFELIEHVDKTDVLLENAYHHLKDNGLMIFSFPNLASLYCRLELFLGFQPHVLEASNIFPNCGMGLFGKFNNPSEETLHHVRGLTQKAVKELVEKHGFEVRRTVGHGYRHAKLFSLAPSLSPLIIFVCRKKKIA